MGPEGPPSPPQELEVGGHRPPYLLVEYIGNVSCDLVRMGSAYTKQRVSLKSPDFRPTTWLSISAAWVPNIYLAAGCLCLLTRVTAGQGLHDWFHMVYHVTKILSAHKNYKNPKTAIRKKQIQNF